MFQACAETERREGLVGELPYLGSSSAFFWVAPGSGGPPDIEGQRVRRARAQRVEVLIDTLAVYTGRLLVTMGRPPLCHRDDHVNRGGRSWIPPVGLHFPP